MSNRHWDQTVAQVESKTLKGWLDWDFIEEEYIRPAVSGDRGVYYIEYFLDKYLPRRPVPAALSLGCGGGNLERALICRDAAAHIDAFDFSAESIRLARQLAEENGLADRIHYEVCDVNKIRLEEGKYDFVIAKMALHHFRNLEHVFTEAARALKLGGLFMFNDFVGPSRFQWTDLQLKLMNALLAALPEKNRKSSYSGDLLTSIDRPSVAEMIKMDPSEAVRSTEIIPVLEKNFSLVEYKPYGGTLLHILLTHVMDSFDLQNEDQRSLLRILFLFERTLMEQGVLESDFAFGVARPLPARSNRFPRLLTAPFKFFSKAG